MNKTPKFTDRVLDLAEEIVNYVIAELNENQEEWHLAFKEFSPEEKKALYLAIADAFNDSTKE